MKLTTRKFLDTARFSRGLVSSRKLHRPGIRRETIGRRRFHHMRKEQAEAARVLARDKQRDVKAETSARRLTFSQRIERGLQKLQNGLRGIFRKGAK